MNRLELLPLATLAAALLLGGVGCTGESGRGGAEQTAHEEQLDARYDSVLAKELKADEYGMRRYVVALLKAGPNRDQDSTAARELQQAHLENIRQLAEDGTLILAGPFLDDGLLRGIYVFDVTTVEEARALTRTDPAIQAGRLEMELHPWYGSAALQEVSAIHSRITKDAP